MDTLLLIKSLAFLAAILAVIYGCFIMVKKRGLHASSTSKRLAILEYQRLDQRNSVCLIKVDSHEFLLALGPANLAIHKISTSD